MVLSECDVGHGPYFSYIEQTDERSHSLISYNPITQRQTRLFTVQNISRDSLDPLPAVANISITNGLDSPRAIPNISLDSQDSPPPVANISTKALDPPLAVASESLGPITNASKHLTTE